VAEITNEHDMLNERGRQIDRETARFVRSIGEQCEQENISLRDAELVVLHAVSGVFAEMRLRAAARRRKQREAALSEFIAVACGGEGTS
jgi:hypothetical protein